MSKGLSYKYSGTKGHIVDIAHSLPANPSGLTSNGWNDISHPFQAMSGSHTYEEQSTGLRVRFDKGDSGKNGFAGKNHYHILNPNANNSSDMYLSINGDPVSRGSKASHILPKED